MKITVSTDINTPLEKAWNMYNEPEHVIRWNAASPDWHCPKAENELWPGGKFSYTMSARDGSMSFDFEGQYDKVEEKKYLAYQLTDGREVTVEFSENAGMTRISQTFDTESVNDVEMQRAGWQAILNNFRAYCENNQA